jgi:hypothetical protein
MKIWIVVEESNIDGELMINATPCKTSEVAKRVLSEKKDFILNKSRHFGKENNTEEDIECFEIDERNTSFYIEDTTDDFYEDIRIMERDLIS